MKKLYILKGRRLFKEVFKRGKVFKGTGIRIIVLKCTEASELLFDRFPQKYDSYSNIGIVIGRRYGKAVERNRAKRRIREICRELLSEMRKGFLIVINPLKEFKDQEYRISKGNIIFLFKKAGIMKL